MKSLLDSFGYDGTDTSNFAKTKTALKIFSLIAKVVVESAGATDPGVADSL